MNNKPDDYDDNPYVIEGTTATVLMYAAAWFFIAGVWKTLEVLAFFAKFLPSLH